MNATLYNGLNKIRRTNSMTFNERKALEVALHRRLLDEITDLKIYETIRGLQSARVNRNDPRLIDTYGVYHSCLQLLRLVAAEMGSAVAHA